MPGNTALSAVLRGFRTPLARVTAARAGFDGRNLQLWLTERSCRYLRRFANA
jgi:hypothetical protein